MLLSVMAPKATSRAPLACGASQEHCQNPRYPGDLPPASPPSSSSHCPCARAGSAGRGRGGRGRGAGVKCRPQDGPKDQARSSRALERARRQ